MKDRTWMMMETMLFLMKSNGAFRVFQRLLTGERTYLIPFCVYAKYLACIRKTPCVYTQNLLDCTQNKTHFPNSSINE